MADEICVTDEELGIELVWHGGRTINIYPLGNRDLAKDCRSMSYSEADTQQNAFKAMHKIVEELRRENGLD